MQNRRHFLMNGFSLTAAGLTAAAALTGVRRTRAEEAPPETASVRLLKDLGTCVAPLEILDDLLRDEGIDDVRYVGPGPIADANTQLVARGDADFAQDFAAIAAISIDAGVPAV